MNEPLRPHDARRLARHILENGSTTFSPHALEELAADGKTTVDAVNVIRGGSYEEGELVNGTWRYRACTARFIVVIAFDSETELIVVTGFTRK